MQNVAAHTGRSLANKNVIDDVVALNPNSAWDFPLWQRIRHQGTRPKTISADIVSADIAMLHCSPLRRATIRLGGVRRTRAVGRSGPSVRRRRGDRRSTTSSRSIPTVNQCGTRDSISA